jgi:quercetin dioxygenase-like cupin family protein
MNSQPIIAELKSKYPGKNIIKNPADNPTEIICEIDPTPDHPNYDVAIAVIDVSKPHYHQVSTETYEIINGELDLFIDGIKHHLKEGDSLTIEPGRVHYAIGSETWIKATSRPGWIPSDHLFENT